MSLNLADYNLSTKYQFSISNDLLEDKIVKYLKRCQKVFFSSVSIVNKFTRKKIFKSKNSLVIIFYENSLMGESAILSVSIAREIHIHRHLGAFIDKLSSKGEEL